MGYMTRDERGFLNDVLGSLEDWEVSHKTYHENGAFCIDITIDDMDEWSKNRVGIREVLEEVCNDWDACLDSDMNCYYIALEADGEFRAAAISRIRRWGISQARRRNQKNDRMIMTNG